MIKKRIGVIGCGKWGTKVINELKSIANIKFIYNSKDNYKIFEPNIDWVFVLTPDKTHYEIVKFFINKKINVFCEKPLALNTQHIKNLLSLSKKFKTKLYIDDVENFKDKIIKSNNNINNIIRTKKDVGTAKSLLNRLAYHDFYLLNKSILLDQIKSINSTAKKKILKFNITLKNKVIFNFYYNISLNTKKHFINYTNFNKFKNNPLKDMLKFVLYNKNDFTSNNDNALFCVKLINKIKKTLS